MKLLLLSDTECPALWDYFVPERLEGIDAIISCGDLKRDYLEFLVTMGRAPVFYVAGNHDTGYLKQEPEGCQSLEDQVVTWRGLRMLGFGGCIHYSGEPLQYTEQAMAKRIRKMRWPVRRAGGIDLLVTHAPAAGYGDAPDPAHKGFACFVQAMDQWQPLYLVHGHVHQNYGLGHPRVLQHGQTRIVNAYERYILDIDDELLHRRHAASRGLPLRLPEKR